MIPTPDHTTRAPNGPRHKPDARNRPIGHVPRSLPATGATDLDYCSEMGTPNESAPAWPICPKRGHVTMRNKLGELTTGRCLSISCYACIWARALRTGAAIGLAKPQWFITLTQVGSGWSQIRARMKHLNKTLNRARVSMESAWHVEANPQATGHHVHMWAHGRGVTADSLSAAAASADMGHVVHVEHVRQRQHDAEVRTLAYGMKACQPPASDLTALWPEAREYLDVNGGHLVHTSRGFWRDGTGQLLSGVREATTLARAAQGRGEWVLHDAA